jgi:bifunctional non-homologous end joining protein LigD
LDKQQPDGRHRQGKSLGKILGAMRLSDLPPGPAIDALRPMLLDKRKHAPFDAGGWAFEIKYDGWRLLAEFGSGSPKLRTRQGLDASAWFPEIGRALARFEGGRHVVDGEVCVLDQLGRSDFERLQARARRKCWYQDCDPVVFCVFDLLVQSGRSVMSLPYCERKRRLTRLLSPKPKHSLLVVQGIAENGVALFAHAVALQLEGIVGKRKDSVYTPGERTEAWRKVRRPGAVPPERFRFG